MSFSTPFFFVKNEVEFNENLASYFATEIAIEYFKYSQEKVNKLRRFYKVQSSIKKKKVELIRVLKNKYKQEKTAQSYQGLPEERKKEQMANILNTFIKDTFIPQMKAVYRSHGLKDFSSIERPWNNAMFSAYLTYENLLKKIRDKHVRSGLGVKEFYFSIENAYEKYVESGEEQSFTDVFLSKANHETYSTH